MLKSQLGKEWRVLGRERHVPCGSFDSKVPIFGPPSIERAACLGSRELSGRLSVHRRLGDPCTYPFRTLAWLHFPRT